MTETGTLTAAKDTDRMLIFWRSVWLLVAIVTALPLFYDIHIPLLLPYIPTLVIHEMSGFAFFGHTLFSNIWCMRVRQTQNYEAGYWANQMIRKMAIGITLPTSILTPLAGLMLIGHLGGLHNNPWAYEAYLCFWIMAVIQLIPDIIIVWRDKQREKPKHGMMGGALRGMASTFLTIYIIFCMASKQSLFVQYFL
jgi:hypothetical protein